MMDGMQVTYKQPLVVWRSPRDAFADVLYYYERYGFYSFVEWFTHMPTQHIYNVYERMQSELNVPQHFFNITNLDTSIADDSEEGPLYVLAETMRDIVQGTFPTQFYTICRLFVLLAEANPDMLQSVPAWMSNSI